MKLENTNAKYALANIFVSFTRDPERKDVDHVVHIFGRNLSKNTFYWEDPTIERERAPDRFFSSAKGDYAAFVLNGENGQGDSYGMHGFLMIPLDEHQQMEVILANAYGFGKHHVYLRVFGYLE